jgi:hypothetical protein
VAVAAPSRQSQDLSAKPAPVPAARQSSTAASNPSPHTSTERTPLQKAVHQKKVITEDDLAKSARVISLSDLEGEENNPTCDLSLATPVQPSPPTARFISERMVPSRRMALANHFFPPSLPMANSNGKLKSTEWFATLPPLPPTEPSSSLQTKAMPTPFPTPALLPWTRPGRASSTTRKIPAARPSTADILRPGLSTESRLRVPLHSKNSRRIASSTKTKPTPGTMPCTFAINR